MHKDVLKALDHHNSVSEKLRALHKLLQAHHPFIDRIAVATYDAATDMVKTFAYSAEKLSPLHCYDAPLQQSHSLKIIKETGQPRVVQDLKLFADGKNLHTQRIFQSGYRSSYTLPMFWEDQFFGFIFFNSQKTNVMHEPVLAEMDIIAHLITLIIHTERANIRTLLATVRSALRLTHARDPETGTHLERMSHYARLIAKNLADKHKFDDAYIEHIFLFSSLHDIGKISIPDRILLKPGPLTVEERNIMCTHAEEGFKLINNLVDNYGLADVSEINMLRNITRHHHEAVDGSGYPHQLRGDAIPIEARIVAVADIFDALTNIRPYKRAFTNLEAFDKLHDIAGIKIDDECAHILTYNKPAIEAIQLSFHD